MFDLVTQTAAPSTRVQALEAENALLRRLLAQAGIDAQALAVVQAGRDAERDASLAASRAETVDAREDARLAQQATGRIGTVLATSEALVADLQASQALLNAILDTVPVGILVADAPGGRIVMGNRRVEEILGHPPIYSTDTSTYDAYVAFHADGRQVGAEEWPLARVVDGADRAELEAHYQRPDGRRVWIAVNGEAVRADGVTVGAVIAFRSIEDRKQADATQDIINRELSHRLKNTLALVQSIAAQTLRNAPSIEAARDALAERLVALGRAHDVLLAGQADSAGVADVARGALALHEDVAGRFRLSGPPLLVGPNAALSLALMLHELATNATKYGALSTAAGHVDVTWAVEGDGEAAEFRLTWTESGGPPVTPPTRKGFGSRLIERGFSGQAEGSIAMDFRPDGLSCVLCAQLAGFQAAE